MSKIRVVLLSSLVVAVFLLGWFVWPRAYIIAHEKKKVLRVNRFTGARYLWAERGRGWIPEAEKDAEDQVRSARVLEQLNQIRVDDRRGDIVKLAIYNPTDWRLGASDSHNAVIEYYKLEGSREDFLAIEDRNEQMKSRTHNDLHLGYLPSEVRNLPAGTHFVQRITITFDTAQNADDGGNAELITLEPPFVFKHQRPWVAP